MSTRSKKTGGSPNETADRIIEAAYRCFERYGFAKTTMEDIAGTAGVTRATVYKYYPSREQVLQRIVELEIAKVNAELRRRFVRRESIEDSLTECLLLVIRAAAQNPYLRSTLQSIETLSTAADRNSPMHRQQRQWWSSLLDDAARAGELASDLDMDEIVSWLTLSEQMLLIKVDAVTIGDKELRHFIRRMIVLPLLARSTATAARAGAPRARKAR